MNSSSDSYSRRLRPSRRRFKPGTRASEKRAKQRAVSIAQPSHRHQPPTSWINKQADSTCSVDVDLPANLMRCIAASGVFSPGVYRQHSVVQFAGPGPLCERFYPHWLSGDPKLRLSAPEELGLSGRLHSDVVNATLNKQMTELLRFGYGRDDLLQLRNTVGAEVRPWTVYCGSPPIMNDAGGSELS